MNFKACCGLLGGRDDEDHDYEDMEQEPLPKPQPAADLRRKKVCKKSSKKFAVCLSLLPKNEKTDKHYITERPPFAVMRAQGTASDRLLS